MGFLLILSCLTSTVFSQAGVSVWPQGAGLTAADRREVVALAKDMGIDGPLRVNEFLNVFVGYRFLIVESQSSGSGRERRSTRAQMFRDDWLGFRGEQPTGAGPHRVGRWISVGEAEAVTRWRIEDGSWFVDVFLESGDKYDDAELIVMAMRRGTLVNRQPDRVSGAVAGQPPIPKLEPRAIVGIQRPWGSWPPPPGVSLRDYQLNLSSYRGVSGETLHVRIVDGSVEFLGQSHWIS